MAKKSVAIEAHRSSIPAQHRSVPDNPGRYAIPDVMVDRLRDALPHMDIISRATDCSTGPEHAKARAAIAAGRIVLAHTLYENAGLLLDFPPGVSYRNSPDEPLGMLKESLEHGDVGICQIVAWVSHSLERMDYQGRNRAGLFLASVALDRKLYGDGARQMALDAISSNELLKVPGNLCVLGLLKITDKPGLYEFMFQELSDTDFKLKLPAVLGGIACGITGNIIFPESNAASMFIVFGILGAAAAAGTSISVEVARALWRRYKEIKKNSKNGPVSLDDANMLLDQLDASEVQIPFLPASSVEPEFLAGDKVDKIKV